MGILYLPDKTGLWWEKDDSDLYWCEAKWWVYFPFFFRFGNGRFVGVGRPIACSVEGKPGPSNNLPRNWSWM